MNLTDPIFTDETKAREHLEAIRWPDGTPVCHIAGAWIAFIGLMARLTALAFSTVIIATVSSP